MSTSREYRYLAPNPKSRYRQLFIKGTRIRAEILYSLTVPSEDGEVYTPEEVAEGYGLPLEAVQEAIEYCRSNPPEIAADHASEERLIEASGMNHPEYKYNPKKYYRILTAQERARLDDDASLPR
ncbi:MAG TPA: hypothetical protein VNK04_22810 [Gemmataceae bacterium]|nr:hypothetical protein [Gemmataceae bacterium]